jgi:transcriptional regulator with XRE-family HTH domain
LTNKIPNILGGQLKNAREKAGLSLESVAKTSTLSNKQLEEIESGGDSSFYTLAIKVTAAKKVGKILGLNEDDFLEKKEPSLFQLSDLSTCEMH